MVVVVLSGTLEVVCVVVVVVVAVVVVVGCVGCGGQGQVLMPGEGGPLTQLSQLRSHEDQISTKCVSIYLLGEGAAVVQLVAEGVEVCEPVALRPARALGLARARGARHLTRDQGVTRDQV